MGHAQYDFFDAEVCGALKEKVQARDQRFGALDREALLADKLGVEEVLEGHGLVELVQHVLFLVGVQRRVVVVGVHVVLNPLHHLRVADVHVLDANRAAVNGLEVLDDFAQRCRSRQAHFNGRLKAAVEVGSAQAKVL